MKKMRKAWLYFLTILTIFISISLVVILNRFCIYQNTVMNVSEVFQEEDSNISCICNHWGEVSCEEIKPTPLPSTSPAINVINSGDYVTEGLTFHADYLSTGSISDLDNKILNTAFRSVSYADDTLKVTLDQKQNCTKQNDTNEQSGKYKIKDNIITLGVDMTEYANATEPCVVQLRYSISPLTLTANGAYIVSYESSSGVTNSVSLCSYNNSLYLDGDIFLAQDNCNTCSCAGGVSMCTTDRKCDTTVVNK